MYNTIWLTHFDLPKIVMLTLEKRLKTKKIYSSDDLKLKNVNFPI